MTKLTNEQLDMIDETVERYKEWIALGGDAYAKFGMLKDCRHQHVSMANGGNGGQSGEGCSIRDRYYKGFPNTFFQRICERMRWEW